MANGATKISGMLSAVRSQLRSDLRQMAEEVLQQSLGTGRDSGQASDDGRNLDLERLRTELVLRTMASRYALLSRIDTALDPPGQRSVRLVWVRQRQTRAAPETWCIPRGGRAIRLVRRPG